MKVLNYNEAIRLAKELSDDLEKEDKLMIHCRLSNLNYQNVVSFVRGNRKAKQPKLISDFLHSVGCFTTIDKQITYNFIVDTNDSEYLHIDTIINK